MFYSLPIQLYLVDAFRFAASAVSAASVSTTWLRLDAVADALFYAGLSIDDGLCVPTFRKADVRCSWSRGWKFGMPWLSFLRCCLNYSVQLLAGLAIVLGIPFPVWVYYKGEAIRLNSKVHL